MEKTNQQNEWMPLAEAAAVAPGGPYTYSQVRRWAVDGVTCADGTRLYLRTIRPGREYRTTAQAIVAFGEERVRRDRAAREAQRDAERARGERVRSKRRRRRIDRKRRSRLKDARL